MLTAFTVSVCAIALLLPALHAKFLDPDPLAIVVSTLESFANNQTALLAAHLDEVHALVSSFNSTISLLASFLQSEVTRGENLRKCLQDPSFC